MYLNQRLGARGIAQWLNENGYRTRFGRPWSHMGVLTVLRNEAYLGKVNFRGAHHQANHPALIDQDSFDATQRLLTERGEDHVRRRAEASDYLLSGLLVCGQCGKHFIGTAAHGKRQRYRYYTCNSRLRHGSTECTADRLPAEELDDALIEALLNTYDDTALLDQALADARARHEADEPQRGQELAAIDVEMRRTEESTDRYFSAFESGSMPESVCAPRIQRLADKLTELRRRRTELLDAAESAMPVPTLSDLRDLGEMVREAFEAANDKQKKAWLRALVAEVRVDDRDAIYPVFRIPVTGVRHLSGLVVLTATVEPAGRRRRLPTRPGAPGSRPAPPSTRDSAGEPFPGSARRGCL